MFEKCNDSDNDVSDDRDDFFSFNSYTDIVNNSEVSNDNLSKIEALAYFDNKHKSYVVLKTYPTVKNIFLKYNTTLSSSASVERFFSQGILVMVPSRNRLDSKIFEILLKLKVNKSIQ